MASTATRKRPEGQRRKKAPAREREQAAEQATEPTSNETDPTPVADDRTGVLIDAYHAAINDCDEDGAIPSARLATVKDAYVALPKRDRGKVTATLHAKSTALMIRKDGTADTGRVHAIATLSALFNEHYDAPSVTPHDPAPGIAGLLAAVDQFREQLHATLTDDVRDRVAAINIATNEQAHAACEAALETFRKAETRAMNGRSRKRSGYSGPQRDLGALTRKALEDAEGNQLSFSAVCKLADISNGALIKRWRKDNIPGVRAVGEDAGGQRAFELA